MPTEFPIIEKLGGRNAVYIAIKESCGLSTPDALRMWTQRGQISRGQHVLTLWRLASERGLPCSPEDFELREQAA